MRYCFVYTSVPGSKGDLPTMHIPEEQLSNIIRAVEHYAAYLKRLSLPGPGRKNLVAQEVASGARIFR